MTTYQKVGRATATRKAQAAQISFDLVFSPAASGMLSVKVIASQLKQSVVFDTGINLFPQDWNRSACKVESSHPHAKSLNQRIRKIIYDLEGFVIDQDGDCSLSRLKRVWEEHLITSDWYEMFASKIETRDITNSTKENHRNVLSKLRQFRSSCDISEISDDFFREFYNFHKGKVCDYTLDKYIQICKTYYAIAKRMYGDIVPYASFDWFKPTPRNGFVIKALNEDDIRKIENYVMKPSVKPSHKLDMQRFLFMCYSGMRVSDFKRCTRENFSVEDGITWLAYTSQKTHIFTKVPVSRIFDGRVEQLLTAHEDDLESFFNVKDRCHFNERIKKICKKEIGIERKVTTHVGRHTFATRLVNKEVPITTIAKVIGHNNIKTTMIYAKTSDSTLVKQLCV